MSERIALADRRHAESFHFNYEGHELHITVGCDPIELVETGRAQPIEVFIRATKSDSGLDALCEDIGIHYSMLLQYGASPQEIGHALRRNPNGSRASLVGALADRIAEFRFGEAGT
jgi:hypothetical protein